MLDLLQSHEIAQAARVCKSWTAIASTPYLWRHLSFISADRHCHGKYIFTEVKPGSKMPWQNIIARARGNLVGVEFAYIAHHQVLEFARALKVVAASSIKHLRWSIPSGWRSPLVTSDWIKEAALRVLELAQACPNIATVEAMCQWELKPPRLFMDGALQVAKLDRFRTDLPLSEEVRFHLLSMLSLARTVILCTNRESLPYRESWLLELLRSNTVLEELSCHYMTDKDDCDTVGLTTSLSLRRLDWEPAGPVWCGAGVLHAPNLSELSTDARFLCKLSDASLSNLSTLKVRVLRPPRFERHSASLRSGPTSLQGLQRITRHAGHVTLHYERMAWREVSSLIDLLISDLVWPGLAQVTFTLVEDLVALPCIIAARKAAARGASREQYLAIANGTPSSAMSPVTGDATYDGPSLCVDTQWTIDDVKYLPVETRAWLKSLENVSLYV